MYHYFLAHTEGLQILSEPFNITGALCHDSVFFMLCWKSEQKCFDLEIFYGETNEEASNCFDCCKQSILVKRFGEYNPTDENMVEEISSMRMHTSVELVYFVTVNGSW